jgi:DNA polymerase sigma
MYKNYGFEDSDPFYQEQMSYNNNNNNNYNNYQQNPNAYSNNQMYQAQPQTHQPRSQFRNPKNLQQVRKQQHQQQQFQRSQPKQSNYQQQSNQQTPQVFAVPARPKNVPNNKNAKFMKTSPQNTPPKRDLSKSSTETSQSTSRESSAERKRKGWVSINKTVLEERNLEWTQTFQRAMASLQTVQDGDEVNVLRKHLQLPMHQWDVIKNEVFNDLNNCLKFLNVKKILMFGSAITGLDLCGSDIDFYVQVRIFAQFSKELILKCVKFSLKKYFLIFQLNKQPTEEEIGSILNRTTKLIGNYKVFYTLCRITHARVPIVKAIHTKTKTMCDINFSSGFGYYNSYFINNILGFDPRIREVAFLLKLWSKSYNIAEKMKLSSYCLIMMLFFYLQNLEKPMLLSIKESQKGLPPIILNEKLRWNFNLSAEINLITDQKQTTRELLEGFFEFWVAVKHEESMASLYTGTLIKKSDFDTHPDLENYREMVLLENVRPMKTDTKGLIIQDGFELNLNIAFKNQTNCDEFFELLKISNEKIQQLKNEKFSVVLFKLLTDVRPTTKRELKQQKSIDKKFSVRLFANEGDLKVVRDHLIKQDNSKIYEAVEIRKFFVEAAVKAILRFLQEIYLVDVTLLKEATSEQNLMSEYHLKLDNDTVTGRKKLVTTSEEKIKKEIEISRNKKNSEPSKGFDLDIVMQITSNDSFKSLELTFLDRSTKKKSTMPQFTSFFAMNAATTVKSLIKLNYGS